MGYFRRVELPGREVSGNITSGRYDYYNKVHSGFEFGVNPNTVTGIIDQLPDADIWQFVQIRPPAR